MDDERLSMFPQELQEVLTDSIAEYWQHMPELHEAGLRFFHSYADQTLQQPLEPGETREARLATTFVLMFTAGREHAIRGYRPPFPKEVPPGEIPEDLEDEIERMRDNGEL